jgi:hypothetical protein
MAARARMSENPQQTSLNVAEPGTAPGTGSQPWSCAFEHNPPRYGQQHRCRTQCEHCRILEQRNRDDAR